MMDKKILKRALRLKTGCTLQYNGWPCGTCFFSMGKTLNNKDWQAVLLYRGDYKKEDLDNLPSSVNRSLNKVLKLAQQ